MNKPYFCLEILALAAIGSAGCSSPRIVRGITSRADEVKFLYYEGGDSGVIRCRLGADGVMSNCQPMTLVLED